MKLADLGKGRRVLLMAKAQKRIADAYDQAHEDGEVVGPHNGAEKRVSHRNAISIPTSDELGFTRKFIMEARQICDAEAREPGIRARMRVLDRH